MSRPPEVILLIGLPASGKSTFFGERFAATHEHVSKDLISRSADKKRRQRAQIRAALTEGKSVVVDNLNASREERAEAIDVARAFGSPVFAYWFRESVADCRERNSQREGAANVPLVAIYSAAKRFVVPGLNEGIDRLWMVRLRENGFEVGEE